VVLSVQVLPRALAGGFGKCLFFFQKMNSGMKKNIIGLVLLILLGSAAYIAYKQRGKGTLKPALHDFAVADTAAVTKVFLADKYGRNVLLERKGEKVWELNGRFKARKDLMDVLLKTIARVEMKAPVAGSAHDNIVKLMAGKSIRTEIYKGDKLVKTYYVGDATGDNMGTYMLIEGSSTPFICHIPGFYGYLTARYVTDEATWRDTEIFANRLTQIKELAIDYFEHPDKSFRIRKDDDGRYSLETLHPTPQPIAPFDTVELMRYLLGYDNIRFEKVMSYDAAKVDSIVRSPRYYRITLTEPGGRVRSLTTYRIPFDPDHSETVDAEMEWDPDHVNGIVNDNTDEVVLAQYFVLDRLTVDPFRFRTGR
jgi:hypothetical protein